MRKLAFATLAVAFTASTVHAGMIESACLKSSRKGVSRQLCGCIQQAADLTLDRSDQRMAAKFFRDPHQAQEVRQSSSRSHEAFWQRYKEFGSTAEAFCS